MCLFRFNVLCFFLFWLRLLCSLMSFASVVLILVSSVPRQEIGWKERVLGDVFDVRVGRKTLTQFLNSVEILTSPVYHV